MIDLITGLPGNSKTLFTISWLRDFAKAENRQVFYSGVPLTDVGKETLGWIELDDAAKWMEVPPNSVVVIDESQRIFRNRTLGTVPGKHVTDLETHRHLGIDLVFITQHPSLIDPAIRKLSQRHRHIVRPFGMDFSTIHQWEGVRDDCDKAAAKKVSQKTKWVFDKTVYPLYKSAEVHTVKRRIPIKFFLIPLIPILFLTVVYNVVSYVAEKNNPKKAQAAANAPGLGQGVAGYGPGYPPPRREPAFDPVEDAKKYVYANTPRVSGLQYTAPKFDELTRPSSVPVPVACVATAKRCQCYTQQGTRLTVSDQVCRDVAEFGFFQEFQPSQNSDKRDASLSVVGDTRPERTASAGPAVYDLGCDGYGVHGKRTC